MLKEPDLQCFVQAEEDEDGDGGADADKPKKKKAKKDSLFYKKSKTDPNAPSSDRMPLPELLVSRGPVYLEKSCFILLDFTFNLNQLVQERCRQVGKSESFERIIQTCYIGS